MLTRDDHRRRLCRAVSYLVPIYAAVLAGFVIWLVGPINPSTEYRAWVILTAHLTAAVLIPTILVSLVFPVTSEKWYRALIAAGLSLCLYTLSFFAILIVLEILEIRL